MDMGSRRGEEKVLLITQVLNQFKTNLNCLFCQRHTIRQNQKPNHTNKTIPCLPVKPSFGSRSAGAVITVEAALAIPIFLFIISIFFSFFSIQIWQLRLQKALDEMGEDIAVWSYLLDFADDYTGLDLMDLAEGSILSDAISGDGESLGALIRGEKDLTREVKTFLMEKGSAILWQQVLKQWLIEKVGRVELNASLIDHGAGGLSLSGSTLHNRELDLVLHYQAHSLLGEPFGISYPVVQRSCHRLWIGTPVEKDTKEEEEEQPEEAVVYVTEGGAAYHGSTSCRVFQIHPFSVGLAEVKGLRNTEGGKYYPCERCVMGKTVQALVWLTDFGVRYHNASDCPSLKRMIIHIALSEAQEKYRPCGFCGGQR